MNKDIKRASTFAVLGFLVAALVATLVYAATTDAILRAVHDDANNALRVVNP